jgi:hypothetical protein
MSRGRNKKDLEPSGFATHMLALAKPPSMSKGRVYCMREEKVVLNSQQMTALNIKLFILKKVQEK